MDRGANDHASGWSAPLLRCSAYLHHTTTVAGNPSHVVNSATCDVDAAVDAADAVHSTATGTASTLPRCLTPTTTTGKARGTTVPFNCLRKCTVMASTLEPSGSKNATRALLFTLHVMSIASSVCDGNLLSATGNRMSGDSVMVAGSPFSLTTTVSTPVSSTGTTSPCTYSGVSVGDGDRVVVNVADVVTVVDVEYVTDGDTDTDVDTDVDVEYVTDVETDTESVVVTEVDVEYVTDVEGETDVDVVTVSVTVTEVVTDVVMVSLGVTVPLLLYVSGLRVAV